MPIEFYENGKEYDFLSNVSRVPVKMSLNGEPISAFTSESIYQGLKGLGEDAPTDRQAAAFIRENRASYGELRKLIITEVPGATLFNEYDKPFPPDQTEFLLKEQIMYEILLAKATQNPKICAALLNTNDDPIYERAPDDNFWGNEATSNSSGLNKLGKAWERVRKTLRQEYLAGKIPVRVGLSSEVAKALGHTKPSPQTLPGREISKDDMTRLRQTVVAKPIYSSADPMITIADAELVSPKPATDLNARLANVDGSTNALQAQMQGSAPDVSGGTTHAYEQQQRPLPSVTIKGPTAEELKAALESKIAATKAKATVSGIVVTGSKTTTPAGQEKIVYLIEKRTPVTMSIENKEVIDEIKAAAAKVEELKRKVEAAGSRVVDEQKKFDDAKREYDLKLKDFHAKEEKRKLEHQAEQQKNKNKHEADFNAHHAKWKADMSSYAAAQTKKVDAAAALKATFVKLGTNVLSVEYGAKRIDSFIREEENKHGGEGKVPSTFSPFAVEGSDTSRKAIIAENLKTIEYIMNYLNANHGGKGGKGEKYDTSPKARKELTLADLKKLMDQYKEKSKQPKVEDVKQSVEAEAIPRPGNEPVLTPYKEEEFTPGFTDLVEPNAIDLDKAKQQQQKITDELNAAEAALQAIQKPTSQDVVSHVKVARLGHISYNTEKQRVDINFKSQKSEDIKEVVESVKVLEGQVRIHNAANKPELSTELATQSLLTLGKAPEFDPPWSLTAEGKAPPALEDLCNKVKENIEQHIKTIEGKLDEIAKLQENFNKMLKDNGIPLKGLEYAVKPVAAAPEEDEPLVFTGSRPDR